MSSKKHILVISQYFYPEQFRINDMCQEWIKRGYKVTVVTGIPNYPEGKFYAGYSWTKKRKENWNGIEIIRIPLIVRGHNSIGLILNYFSFPISGYIWKCFTNIKPDYIFMFETSPMTQCKIGVWLKHKYDKRGYHIPLYAYIQDLWPENVEIVTGIHSPLVIKPIDKMVRCIYKNCNEIFATSPSFVKEICKKNDNRRNVHYWPQYAEEFYKPQPKNNNLKIAPEKFKIMFTGNIGFAQGLDILPKVAKLLKKREKNVIFVVVGDGRYKEKLLGEIQVNDVEDMFLFTGRKQAIDIPELLANADAAFLSFMDNELFAKTIPAKLQSYMACGVPIIASARGETTQVLKKARCGVSSDIGEVQTLSNLIEAMMSKDEKELLELGGNARKYYLNNFEKKLLMDDFEKYLND